jgi:hypothetical protein
MLAMIVLALAGCARRDSTEEAAPADTTTSTPAAEAGSAPAEPAPDQAAPAEPGTMPADVATEPQAGAGPAACDAEAAQRFVGEIYTPELGEQARVASGARVARALRPGEVVTMEFSADRLSLTLDESGRIVRAACG